MKNFFRNKNNIIIGLCAVVILMGIGFAAFSQRLQIGDTTVTNSDWNVYIKSAVAGTPVGDATGSGQVVDRATAKLTANLTSPGDSVTYTITVANDGNIDAVLDVITLSASNNDSVIKYSYSGITEDEELLAETEKSFTVKIEYDPNKTGTVTEAQKQNTLTLDLDFVQKGNESDNSSTGGTNVAQMLAAKAVTSGAGLYADTYESGRYVYKGADPDNYVCLSDEEECSDDNMYRIISVESNGTLKVVKKTSIGSATWESIPSLAYTTKKGSIYEIDNKIYLAVSHICPSVGWSESSLAEYLNETWYNKLTNNINSSLVVDSFFAIGSMTTTFLDSFTTSLTEEKALTWQGIIGLMSATDYVMASTNDYCASIKDYSSEYSSSTLCYENSIDHNWLYYENNQVTMSERDGDVIYITATGFSTTDCSASAIRPVFYLKSNINLDNDGTSTSPYRVVS